MKPYQVGTEAQRKIGRHRGTKRNENIQRFAGLAKINDSEIYKISKGFPFAPLPLCPSALLPLCPFEPE
jgi:hypothetical protein